LNIFPEFFKPFVFNFYNEMKTNISQKKNPKIEQVMYIQNEKGEDFPVFMICQPQYEGTSQNQYVLYFKKVVRYLMDN